MAQKAVKKKYKLRKGRVALAVVIVATLLAGTGIGITAIINKNTGKPQTVKPVNPAEIVSDGEYVRIDLEDCNMYVGLILRLKCVSQPGEYADKVIWRSSDDSVVSVNDTGDIIVKSVGTAAITATYGTLSDSVIIKAVERDKPDADSNLPVYDVSDEGEIVVVETAADSAGTAVTDGNGTDAPAATDADAVTIPAGEQEKPAPTTSQPASTENNVPDVTEATQEIKTETRETVAQAVVDFGFKQYVGDTYIFTEDGNYLGEAIVGTDFVQIYVMTRTTGFDNSVKEIIGSLIPDGCEDIFARFVSASRDETLNVAGHMVRIIAQSGGGHAQIIIYY